MKRSYDFIHEVSKRSKLDPSDAFRDDLKNIDDARKQLLLKRNDTISRHFDTVHRALSEYLYDSNLGYLIMDYADLHWCFKCFAKPTVFNVKWRNKLQPTGYEIYEPVYHDYYGCDDDYHTSWFKVRDNFIINDRKVITSGDFKVHLSKIDMIGYFGKPGNNRIRYDDEYSCSVDQKARKEFPLHLFNALDIQEYLYVLLPAGTIFVKYGALNFLIIAKK